MRTKRIVRLGLALVVVAAALACHHEPRVVDPSHYLRQLQSPDHHARRHAADALAPMRDPAALPHLVAAVRQEGYLPALRAELRALGMTGLPQAYPVIVSYTRHANPRVAQAAAAAYRVWLQYRVPVAPGAAAPAEAPAEPPAEPPPAAAPPPAAQPLQGEDEE
jgi:HEAT repeat protein